MKKEISISDFKKCPHCDSSLGYYTKDYVYGKVSWGNNFDGSEADNSEKYDYLNCKNGKIAYCQNCDKKISKIK